jgi:hypothetical protein
MILTFFKLLSRDFGSSIVNFLPKATSFKLILFRIQFMCFYYINCTSFDDGDDNDDEYAAAADDDDDDDYDVYDDDYEFYDDDDDNDDDDGHDLFFCSGFLLRIFSDGVRHAVPLHVETSKCID